MGHAGPVNHERLRCVGVGVEGQALGVTGKEAARWAVAGGFENP